MLAKETEVMLHKLIGGINAVRAATDSLFSCAPLYPPPLIGQVMSEVADLSEHVRKLEKSVDELLRRHKDG